MTALRGCKQTPQTIKKMKTKAVFIGMLFWYPNKDKWGKIWKVSTSGEGDYWGCTCLKTNAFTTFETKELLTLELASISEVN